MAPYHPTNNFFYNVPLPANQKLAIVVPLLRRGPGGSYTPIQKLAVAAPYGGRGERRIHASRPRTPQLGSFAWADASYPTVGGGSAATVLRAAAVRNAWASLASLADGEGSPAVFESLRAISGPNQGRPRCQEEVGPHGPTGWHSLPCLGSVMGSSCIRHITFPGWFSRGQLKLPQEVLATPYRISGHPYDNIGVLRRVVTPRVGTLSECRYAWGQP